MDDFKIMITILLMFFIIIVVFFTIVPFMIGVGLIIFRGGIIINFFSKSFLQRPRSHTQDSALDRWDLGRQMTSPRPTIPLVASRPAAFRSSFPSTSELSAVDCECQLSGCQSVSRSICSRKPCPSAAERASPKRTL